MTSFVSKNQISLGHSVDWVELERPQFVSEMDNHLYAIYADDCARAGNHQEGIQALQGLVQKNQDCIAGCLRLATLFIETFIETGRNPKTPTSIKHAKKLYDSPHLVSRGSDNLPKFSQKMCKPKKNRFFTSLPTNNQTSKYTTKDFSFRSMHRWSYSSFAL